MYKHVDYFNIYGRIMQFNKNKYEPFHRWYPFVEGYSREFIQSIIHEMDTTDFVCLEPFSGSGTTALELQNHNIPCFSFEVNPLMYLISKVKLENEYNIDELKQWKDYIYRERANKHAQLETNFKTLYQSSKIKKWNYDTDVALAIEKLRQIIENISKEKYRELFKVALAAILLDVSNLYRNGKCLSYKKNWKGIKLTEKDVFNKFDNKIQNEIMPDIESSILKGIIRNKERLYNEDSRIGIDDKISDNSIDLVITSPPYLNSRDYTDTYMLELKTLKFTETADEITALRKKTLRSHVQLNWDDDININNNILQETLNKLEEASVNQTMWNNSIIDMVRLYFVDLKKIFNILYKKMKPKGRVYFNVSNSAYFNVLINTLEICTSIAEQEGFRLLEIRDARRLKTSPQQKNEIKYLLEGVIVLEK